MPLIRTNPDIIPTQSPAPVTLSSVNHTEHSTTEDLGKPCLGWQARPHRALDKRVGFDVRKGIVERLTHPISCELGKSSSLSVAPRCQPIDTAIRLLDFHRSPQTSDRWIPLQSIIPHDIEVKQPIAGSATDRFTPPEWFFVIVWSLN